MKFSKGGVSARMSNINNVDVKHDIKNEKWNFRDVTEFTRKDWFSIFYNVFLEIEDNKTLLEYRQSIGEAAWDACNIVLSKNRYEKDDNTAE